MGTRLTALLFSAALATSSLAQENHAMMPPQFMYTTPEKDSLITEIGNELLEDGRRALFPRHTGSGLQHAVLYSSPRIEQLPKIVPGTKKIRSARDVLIREYVDGESHFWAIDAGWYSEHTLRRIRSYFKERDERI